MVVSQTSPYTLKMFRTTSSVMTLSILYDINLTCMEIRSDRSSRMSLFRTGFRLLAAHRMLQYNGRSSAYKGRTDKSSIPPKTTHRDASFGIGFTPI